MTNHQSRRTKTYTHKKNSLNIHRCCEVIRWNIQHDGDIQSVSEWRAQTLLLCYITDPQAPCESGSGWTLLHWIHAQTAALLHLGSKHARAHNQWHCHQLFLSGCIKMLHCVSLIWTPWPPSSCRCNFGKPGKAKGTFFRTHCWYWLYRHVLPMKRSQSACPERLFVCLFVFGLFFLAFFCGEETGELCCSFLYRWKSCFALTVKQMCARTVGVHSFTYIDRNLFRWAWGRAWAKSDVSSHFESCLDLPCSNKTWRSRND